MDFEHIKARLEKPTTKANSERASLIEPFVERLNRSREASGYRLLPAAFYASKMSHIPTHDLHGYYKELDKANNFSALWWWHNAPKKKN